MTEKDLKLIEEAKNTPCCDWGLILDLEKLADTEEAREKIHRISIDKCRREEWLCGCL